MGIKLSSQNYIQWKKISPLPDDERSVYRNVAKHKYT